MCVFYFFDVVLVAHRVGDVEKVSATLGNMHARLDDMNIMIIFKWHHLGDNNLGRKAQRDFAYITRINWTRYFIPQASKFSVPLCHKLVLSGRQ